MVQIATSSTKIEIKPENFNGLQNVTEIAGQDLLRYAAGNFDDYASAANFRKEIESVFPDAFVIAIKNKTYQ